MGGKCTWNAPHARASTQDDRDVELVDPSPNRMHHTSTVFAAGLALAVVTSVANAQANVPTGPARGTASRPASTRAADNALPADSVLVRSLVFRSIGPAVMSGRISDLAVTDNARSPRGRIGNIIYAATATGGVWKSTNAGVTWAPVFDSVRTGSVGAVAVAPSNPDVVWVGTGEPNNMRSSSWGTGVYKSTDGGRTWSSAMLPKSQHIGKIVIDPRDPNVVYVAALGPLWAPGGERGLYKTTDGGKTWTNTNFIDNDTGFTDVAMDASNPNILFAASYQRRRTPWGFNGGGAGSGLWKTTDGGKKWTRLSGNGLPDNPMIGRIGLDISRSKPNTIYASFEVGPSGGTGATIAARLYNFLI